MATQIDSLAAGSFKSFRTWRRRDVSPGRATPQDDGADEAAPTTLCHVAEAIKRELPSPAHPAVRRSRPQIAVPALPPSAPNARGEQRPQDHGPSSAARPPPPEATAQAMRGCNDVPESGRRAGGRTRLSTPEPLGPARHRRRRQPDPPPPCADAVPAGHERASSPRPARKRRRPLSDVDGPNTGSLCRKKRRLRRFLITSRLSQPFSQPATHILNRESVAAGDKRFLKIASAMNAKRIVRLPPLLPAQLATASKSPGSGPSATADAHLRSVLVPVLHAPCPSEALRRGAMANRFRQRICADVASGRSIASAPMQLMTNARFTMVPLSTAPPASGAAHATAAVAAAASCAGLAAVPVACGARQPPKPDAARPASSGERSQPPPLMGHVVGVVRSSGAAAHDGQLDGGSGGGSGGFPEPSYGDDEDDRDCAFPASEMEGGGEAGDDPEDVYSDFSVLFSAASDDADWAEEGLDDYMDELDGIAHLPRLKER